MKYALLLLAFLLFPLSGIYSQLADKELYFFDEFMDATVNFKNETEMDYELNFSFLYNELCFVDTHTSMVMLVKNMHAIEDFEIDDRVFFVEGKALFEVLSDEPLVHVQYKKSVRPASAGGYGTTTETASVDTYIPRVDSWSLERRMAGHYKIGEMEYIYSIEKDGVMQSFRNRKQLQKIYPAQEGLIKKLIKEYSIKFENTRQILELVKLLEGLTTRTSEQPAQ